MAKALSDAVGGQQHTAARYEAAGHEVLDWRKKASDHIAYGLVSYTAMHIFVTMTFLKSEGGSILPYFALVVLVAAIIPACRMVEARWERLSDAEAADPALRPVFVREMALLWTAAIGLPVVLTLAFKAIATLL